MEGDGEAAEVSAVAVAEGGGEVSAAEVSAAAERAGGGKVFLTKARTKVLKSGIFLLQIRDFYYNSLVL